MNLLLSLNILDLFLMQFYDCVLSFNSFLIWRFNRYHFAKMMLCSFFVIRSKYRMIIKRLSLSVKMNLPIAIWHRSHYFEHDKFINLQSQWFLLYMTKLPIRTCIKIDFRSENFEFHVNMIVHFDRYLISIRCLCMIYKP